MKGIAPIDKRLIASQQSTGLTTKTHEDIRCKKVILHNCFH
jgi:hypothetical protein